MNWYKRAKQNKKEFLEQAALKHYGETENINYAGYILEDGRMLNFDEGGGMRSIDHRNIGFIENFGIPDNAYAAMTRIMNTFMNETRAVRVMSHGGQLSIHSNTPLSTQQISVIKRNLQNYNSLNVDIYNGINEEGSSGDNVLNTTVDLQFIGGYEKAEFMDNINKAFNPYTSKYEDDIYDQVRDIVGDYDYSNEDIDYDYDTEESINDLFGKNMFGEDF
jgi:hypothetical protein